MVPLDHASIWTPASRNFLKPTKPCAIAFHPAFLLRFCNLYGNTPPQQFASVIRDGFSEILLGMKLYKTALSPSSVSMSGDYNVINL